MTTCTTPTCRRDYDETNTEEVKLHTEPVNCAGTARRCNRCNGKPGCYTCGDSECHCMGGH
ncbi:hypothetical protein OH540_09025 [Streptomyces sp. BPPL-273]|uniref:hypothetical protein n=1 Tax=unclassified Streptomyces TaxID=2593676 RepID=UPI0024AEBE01|nr:hypothetical protein [Streptomyces sp. BPPL-273]WHM30163.1 hypothetical protein OH540_09025 [Streptomyces sp. BPPL-273]